jgi:hypothetical protein
MPASTTHLTFQFLLSLRCEKSHETGPQWGEKYKAYIYVTVVYWMTSQRNKQPFPMNAVVPDSTISDIFIQLLAQITLKVCTSNFFKNFFRFAS